MAPGSKRDTKSGDIATPRVWTLLITGGLPFQIQIPLTPSLSHNGENTVWKMHGTKAEAQEVVKIVTEKAEAKVQLYTETQTREQEKERMSLLDLDESLLDLDESFSVKPL